MNRYFASAAVALTLLIVAPAAASPGPREIDPSITNGTATKQLNEARADWRASGIRNYSFRIKAYCYCVLRKPVRITVRGKKVKMSDHRWFGPRTIPGVFRVIHGAIHRKAADLDTKYNRSKGYPRRVAIDYDRMMADEEIAYKVTKFRKLGPRR